MIDKLTNLAGRTALITGAAGYLGSILSSALAERGAKLLLVDCDLNSLSQLAQTINSNYGEIAIPYCFDLEGDESRSSLISQVIEQGRLDILVNNASFVGTSNIEGWNSPFLEQSLDSWRRAFELNLTAIFHLTQGLFPLLSKSQFASVINIASIYGSLGPDWSLYKNLDMSNPAAYSTSKAGVIHLTRWLSSTLAPKVRVNAISPGGIFRFQDKEFVDRYTAKTPLNRMATEQDIVGALIYFASDMSLYTTGQNLIIDGGLSIL